MDPTNRDISGLHCISNSFSDIRKKLITNTGVDWNDLPISVIISQYQ